MAPQETSETTVDDPTRINEWMSAFQGSRGASLEFESKPGCAYHVVVVSMEPGEGLLLDTELVPRLQEACDAQAKIHLIASLNNEQVTTTLLPILSVSTQGGKSRARVGYPLSVTVFHRRQEFRAELRQELLCEITFRDPRSDVLLQGRLCDLSLHGCLVRFPMEAVYLESHAEGAPGDDLALHFPNGEDFSLPAVIRHVDLTKADGSVSVGFSFTDVSHADERKLWFFVREIEREHARGASDARELPPSPLFEAKRASDPHRHSLTTATDYATTMARQLAGVAAGIGLHLRTLKAGKPLNSAALSGHADALLGLLEADRQEVLFALICLPRHPALVTHCLAVAARLADVGMHLKMPRETLKAITACALVHDLAKVLSVSGGEWATDLSGADRNHPLVTVHALSACAWLPPEIIREVIGQINERADGSGYPEGLAGSALSELGQLAGVIDAMDSECRPRPGFAGGSYNALRLQLAARSLGLSRKWIDFFAKRFGDVPVGARVIDARGSEYWVRTLSAEGACAALVPCRDTAAITPNANECRQMLTGSEVPGALRELPITEPDAVSIGPGKPAVAQG